MLDKLEEPARVRGARAIRDTRREGTQMGTATEQVTNGKKPKVTVESWKTFDEALEALSELKGTTLPEQEKVMISNVLGNDGKSRVRGYAQSPIILTDDGHVRTWVESISMEPDKTSDQQFRFFLKREAVDLEGARLLATG